MEDGCSFIVGRDSGTGKIQFVQLLDVGEGELDQGDCIFIKIESAEQQRRLAQAFQKLARTLDNPG